MFLSTLCSVDKIKIFMKKLAIRTAVVNPEAMKISRKSAIRYFHAGQYDIIILIRMKYSFKLNQPDSKCCKFHNSLNI